ncbi:unnamed protein product, partial [marine sediment metagenome]
DIRMKLTGMRIGFSEVEKNTALTFMQNALDTGFVADGQYTDAMIEIFKKITGSDVALLSSDTACMELLCHVLKKEYGWGDCVALMPANSWLSVPNAVQRAGYMVRWCDISEESLVPSIANLDAVYDDDIR